MSEKSKAGCGDFSTTEYVGGGKSHGGQTDDAISKMGAGWLGSSSIRGRIGS